MFGRDRNAGADTAMLRCSFCVKSQNDVRKLIAGPKVYICDECIELCNDILTEEHEEERSRSGDESRPDERSRSTGVAVCRFCGLAASMDQVAMVPDRGFLCFVCLDAIRAVSEPEPNNGQ